MDRHGHGTRADTPTTGSRLTRLGRRGEGWVAEQLVLLAAVLLSALLGFDWPGGPRTPAHVVGWVLIGLGVLVLAISIAQLAGRSSLTIALTLFFELKSRREEAWLVQHCAGYAEYRRRTPHRFLPLVRLERYGRVRTVRNPRCPLRTRAPSPGKGSAAPPR